MEIVAHGGLDQIPIISAEHSLAEKVFAEGREKGLVDIHAVAVAAGQIAATVWFPKYAARRGSGLESRNETFYFGASATRKNNWCSALVVTRVSAGFRQYQKEDMFIGTIAWAAA